MIDNVNEQLVLGFLDGRATTEDKQALKEWLALSVENRAYFRQQWSLWHQSAAALQDARPAFVADYEVFAGQNGIESEAESVKRWSLGAVLLRVAAIFLLLLIPTAAFMLGRRMGATHSPVLSMETSSGTHSKIVLADKSVVWLNSGSRLECAPGFGRHNRTVRLEGEGYFEVARNERKPFLVKTDHITLRVLGTKFNLRDYDYDRVVRVDLMQGSVEVCDSAHQQTMRLKPNERMLLDKATGSMRKERFDVTEANLWVSDQIFFNEKPLGAIAADLSRLFGVKITVEPAVAQKKFYGFYHMENTTVDEILSSIVATGQVRLRKSANEYILY